MYVNLYINCAIKCSKGLYCLEQIEIFYSCTTHMEFKAGLNFKLIYALNEFFLMF